jgi:hypothetical protein
VLVMLERTLSPELQKEAASSELRSLLKKKMTVAIRVRKPWASCAFKRCLDRSATYDFQYQGHAGRQLVDDC